MKNSIVSLLAVLASCFASLTASAAVQQQSFDTVAAAAAATEGKHNLRFYPCKVNQSGKMCMSGRAMSLDEIRNFMDSRPRTLAEGIARGMTEEQAREMMKYCGGLYAVWEDREVSEVPPPQPPVEQERVAEQAPPEPAKSKSFSFLNGLFSGISVNLVQGGGDYGYGYEQTGFVQSYQPVRRSYCPPPRAYCPPRQQYCPPSRGFYSTLPPRYSSRGGSYSQPAVRNVVNVKNTNVNRNYNTTTVRIPRSSSESRPSTRQVAASQGRPVFAQGVRTADPRGASRSSGSRSRR